MKLSVIIPNYNNEEYLVACIDSILRQTFKPHEIIIVDDNSTDKSREIIERYQRKFNFIRPIFIDRNMGVSYARNIGIINSTGDYITTIDSDDYYYDINKLRKEMNLIKFYKEKYNEDIISYSKTIRVDINGEYIKGDEYNPEKYYYFEGNILLKLLIGVKIQCLPRDYCYSKRLYIEGGGYDSNMNLYEDLDLLVKLSKKVRFYSTKHEGTAYRQKENGLSKRSVHDHDLAKDCVFKRGVMYLPIYKRILCIVLKGVLMWRRKLKSLKLENII